MKLTLPSTVQNGSPWQDTLVAIWWIWSRSITMKQQNVRRWYTFPPWGAECIKKLRPIWAMHTHFKAKSVFPCKAIYLYKEILNEYLCFKSHCPNLLLLPFPWLPLKERTLFMLCVCILTRREEISSFFNWNWSLFPSILKYIHKVDFLAMPFDD